MTVTWKDIFDSYGIKRVTRTDKGKAAYLPNAAQRVAIKTAGIKPAASRPAPEFDILVLDHPQTTVVKASYYHSERLDAAKKRRPEARMGHEFISSQLKLGDRVVIGNVGDQIFAIKLGADPVSGDKIIAEVVRKASKQTVYARAKRAKGKPRKRTVQRDDFVRDPYVVAAAVLRSGGECEMPGCTRILFFKDNDTPYLEVHHVVPLGEEGDDALANVAALCPHCHRELHSGKGRAGLRAVLAAHVATLVV